ncbi:MAG: multicopper oxidase domain-containing protein [Alphaproteobacteria bacterium]|nr:multicopper oxidase domain-containing protein [Alphaproteobacteria bacterium]
MSLSRRHLLRLGGATALAAGVATVARAQPSPPPAGKADYTLRIGTGLVELDPDTVVSTRLYNGQFPGPLLRLDEGRRVVVDIHNDTDTPEQLHWHGQFLPDDVDGAVEEGTPYIPARGQRRIVFTPGPAGFRFYHSHLRAGRDLSLGLYSGLAGPVYVAPRREAGAYDREIFLVLKEFGPYLSRTEMALDFLSPTATVPALRAAQKTAEIASLERGLKPAYDVAYEFAAINGRRLGHGEPIRVKPGERVLFHILNASATAIHSLALPGHVFRVVALDGNPVPRPAEVPVLWLGNAERISVIVEMKTPGVWVLGETVDDDRRRGLGVVVEYAGVKGAPVWRKPAPFRWDYRRFAAPGAVVSPPDEVIDMTIAARDGAAEGFDQFTINGMPFDMEKMAPRFRLARGRRYRLRFRNATDDIHPIHLHRHTFELTSIAGAPTSGVRKDVAMLGAFQEMTVDFTADQPGLSLFHCHMQDHMDYGFMALFDCA